jgi:transposase
MAWQQTEPIMNQKIQFAFRAKSSANFSELCREYGISTKTGYKWKARFEAKGPEGLKEESRRPKSSPEALSEEVVCRLVRIKESHRHWGARKLQIVYERAGGKPRAKAASSGCWSAAVWSRSGASSVPPRPAGGSPAMCKSAPPMTCGQWTSKAGGERAAGAAIH